MTVIRLAGLTGQIRARVLPKLPPLAWLLSLSDPEPALLCGTGVETFDGGFFEGCWAGDFDERNFDQARHVFGSGGKIINGEALFVTPSHTLDALYAVQRGNGFVVANSLPFLVQFAALELPYDFSIVRRFTSIKEGLDSYERVIFRGQDWTLYRIAYENFGIRGQDIRWIPKLSLEETDFTDYVSYRNFLLDTLGRVVRNGCSLSRKAHYSLVTSCSSGYDSTACAALATTLGCCQALTLRTARTAGGFNSLDSGRRVADALGLEVIELERMARAAGDEFAEAEFFATGLGGEDYAFRAFAPHCEQRILLTGFHGDIVWDRHAKPANNLARKDLSGSTLSEFRLRHDFVHVPVAFIGATRHDVLLRIANSQEMRPYQVSGHYDRPIARRIAEERGVPRGYFGQSKKGSSIAFGYLSLYWSKVTLDDLQRFEHRILGEKGISASYYARWAAQTGAQLGWAVIGKPAGRIGLARPRDWLFKRMTGATTLIYSHVRYGSMATLWAIDKIRARYSTEQEGRANARDQSRQGGAQARDKRLS